MSKKNNKPIEEQISELIEDAQKKAREKVLDSIVKDGDEFVTDDGEIVVDSKEEYNINAMLPDGTFVNEYKYTEDFLPKKNTIKESLKPKRKKLGKTASLIYEKLLTLPEHRAMLLPEITQWLWEEHQINLADSTVHQKHLKPLEPWGLQHDKRIGFSIIQDKKV